MVEVFRGSIFDAGCEAIVNPANSFLYNGAGLAGLIQKEATAIQVNESEAAAVALYKREVKATPLIPYGGASLTSSGLLINKGIKYIIHAVGPIWGGGDHYEEELLTTAYDNSLMIAEENAIETIALPAISAGIFGVPIDVVARCAAASVRYTTLPRVVIAVMEDAHEEAFRKVLS